MLSYLQSRPVREPPVLELFFKALRPSSRAIWEPVGLVAETGCSPILLNVHLFYSTNIQ